MKRAYAAKRQTFESDDAAPFSAEGTAVRLLFTAQVDYRRGSAADWWPTLNYAFARIERECGSAGWDGEGSEPVELKTITIARHVAVVLYSLLPSVTPPPDVVAEPDGDIGFSWDVDIERYFVLSIAAEGAFNFTGRFGAEGGHHGWRRVDFDDLRTLQSPLEEIAQFIQRVHRSPPT
jgi:hypothetical protein